MAKSTDHMVALGNTFIHNNRGIMVYGDCEDDTISQNDFSNTAFYHIENHSESDIYAKNNQFFAFDEDFIAGNIYDHEDDPSMGIVDWNPFSYGDDPLLNTELVDDMAEEPALWYAYADTCWSWGLPVAINVSWDYLDKKVGEASVFCETGNGWFVGLQYWPAGDTITSWSLTEQDTLKFWLKTTNNTGYGFQEYHVKVGNNYGGYYRYSASTTVLNNAMGNWRQVKIPLAGGGSPYYNRYEYGEVSLDDISYVSVNADTWEYGFEIWLDGMHFTSMATEIDEMAEIGQTWMGIFPNPVMEYSTISFNLPSNTHLRIALYDISGKEIMLLKDEWMPAGMNKVKLGSFALPKGMYICKLQTGGEILSRKLIVN